MQGSLVTQPLPPDFFLLLHQRDTEEHTGERVSFAIYSYLADEVRDAQSSVYLLQSDAVRVIKQ